jgi:hypothetical protein
MQHARVSRPVGRLSAYREGMPDQPVEIAHPPEALLRAVNPVLRFALRTPLGSALKDFMVVGFSGRKSGKQFSIPVSAHYIDGQLYVLLSAGWKHNFRDGAPATVLHAGKTSTMQGQLISEPAAVAALAHRAADSYGPKKAQRSMGLKFRDDAVPSVDEFTAAASRLGLAAIRLTPAN